MEEGHAVVQADGPEVTLTGDGRHVLRAKDLPGSASIVWDVHW